MKKNSIWYLFKTVEWHDNSYNFQLGICGYCADQQKQKNNMKALNHRTRLEIHMKMNMDIIIHFFCLDKYYNIVCKMMWHIIKFSPTAKCN